MFRKRLVSIMVVTLTVVVGYDSAGVPLCQFTSTISSVGPDSTQRSLSLAVQA